MLETEVNSSQAPVRSTNSAITLANHWDHLLARWAYRRNDHRVEPGLYALGDPTPDSPVFVTANYTLSFDALRSALAGVDGYLLALDTKGVNVWCAAGKGTFGTDELVRRIEAAGLSEIVRHRRLILPQLGAPGVAAHEVKKRTGFKVEYGPVRAQDLQGYLKSHEATPEMRRVQFPWIDRLVLIPVDLIAAAVPLGIAAAVSFFLGGAMGVAATLAAALAGLVLFPLLLPWLPTHDFSTKGFLLGIVVALPFALAKGTADPNAGGWMQLLRAAPYLLALPPVTAFLALNFTGSTTFTSKSGVKREIFAYTPLMAGSFLAGILSIVARQALRALGGS